MDIGATDNLFVHGADTVRAQHICDQMRSVVPRHFVLKDVIRNPTVRQQAALLAER